LDQDQHRLLEQQVLQAHLVARQVLLEQRVERELQGLEQAEQQEQRVWMAQLVYLDRLVQPEPLG
jgi:hypothetical protein